MGSSATLNLVSLRLQQHPAWDVPQLQLRAFFFPRSHWQGGGKTLPPSWVQVVRRISGPGFAFFAFGCWLQGRRPCSAGWCGGLPHRCLLARLFFLVLIFFFFFTSISKQGYSRAFPQSINLLGVTQRISCLQKQE